MGKLPGEGKLAVGAERSDNSKTGPLSITYTSQGSCPSTCVLKGNGCYAESGHLGFMTRRLNASNPDATPEDIARAEAVLIDSFMSLRPLRLHGVGDCSTVGAVRILRAACERYIERTGYPVFCYTHAWADIPRHEWGSIVVRASCETAEQVARAKSLGYSAAIVTSEHASDRAYDLEGEKVVPCPEQTRGIQCVSCKLCFREGATVAFAAHGARTSRVKAIVGDLQHKGVESDSTPLVAA